MRRAILCYLGLLVLLHTVEGVCPPAGYQEKPGENSADYTITTGDSTWNGATDLSAEADSKTACFQLCMHTDGCQCANYKSNGLCWLKNGTIDDGFAVATTIIILYPCDSQSPPVTTVPVAGTPAAWEPYTVSKVPYDVLPLPATTASPPTEQVDSDSSPPVVPAVPPPISESPPPVAPPPEVVAPPPMKPVSPPPVEPVAPPPQEMYPPPAETQGSGDKCPAGWTKPPHQLPAAPVPQGSLTTPDGHTETLDFKQRPNNQFCDSLGPVVDVQCGVYVTDGKSCSLCKGKAVCQIWGPGADGNYQSDCSATINGAQWTMHTNIPGNENEMGWGADPYPHWHYHCCCDQDCGLNKFYHTNHDFMDGLGDPESSNIAKKVGNTYVYNFVIAKS